MTKKFLLILLLTYIVFCQSFCCVAYAETTFAWARVEKDGVNLYADENCEKPLFTLEKSYYVEVLDEVNNVYAVTVMQNENGFPTILGYVRKSEVTPIEATPITPFYPTEQIYVTGDAAQLKLLPLTSSQNVIAAPNTQKLNYYGKISYYGKDWYYVYCAGKFGYVETETVSKPLIALHPTPLQTAKPVLSPSVGADEPNEVTPAKTKTPASEILLIVFVVLLAIGLTLALFLPGNGKKNDVFEQDI